MAVDQRVLTQQMAGLDALEDEGDGRRRPNAAVVWARAWPKLAALALGLALWQVVVESGWREEYILPAPATVFAKLAEIVATGGFWQGVAVTGRRAAVGFGLAVAVGGAVGALVARVRPLRVAVGALITGLQTMPSIAWFPLAILLFKLSEAAITFVVVLGAAPSVANGLIGGIDHVPPILIRAGRMLGARGTTLFRHIILPAAMPSCLAGLKQGWAFAWRSLMAGELLVLLGVPSIGARLQAGREFSDAPLLLAMMIVVLLIGIVVDGLFGLADHRLRRRRGLVDTAT
jgi:NitT/TauT family transport system permease protein